MKSKLLPIVGGLLFLSFGLAHAAPLDSLTATRVATDGGNSIGGFDVSVGTTTTVLLSSSTANASQVYRSRTFQVTDSPYAVFIGTYTPLVWGSGAGWFVLGSTTSFTTTAQGALYGILDPAAAATTATIQGPFEYQSGETR